VNAPVTLIYGDKDWSRIPERDRTKAALKNARMFTLQNTGHFSAVENRTKSRASSCRDRGHCERRVFPDGRFWCLAVCQEVKGLALEQVAKLLGAGMASTHFCLRSGRGSLQG
jgi:hypothetical protein